MAATPSTRRLSTTSSSWARAPPGTPSASDARLDARCGLRGRRLPPRSSSRRRRPRSLQPSHVATIRGQWPRRSPTASTVEDAARADAAQARAFSPPPRPKAAPVQGTWSEVHKPKGKAANWRRRILGGRHPVRPAHRLASQYLACGAARRPPTSGYPTPPRPRSCRRTASCSPPERDPPARHRPLLEDPDPHRVSARRLDHAAPNRPSGRLNTSRSLATCASTSRAHGFEDQLGECDRRPVARDSHRAQLHRRRGEPRRDRRLRRVHEVIDEVGGGHRRAAADPLEQVRLPLRDTSPLRPLAGLAVAEGCSTWTVTARVYSRIRENKLDPADTDVSRTERQQAVIQALLEADEPRVLAKLPIGDEVMKPLTTDLGRRPAGPARPRQEAKQQRAARRLGGTPSFGGFLQPDEEARRTLAAFMGRSAPQPPLPGSASAPGVSSPRPS